MNGDEILAQIHLASWQSVQYYAKNHYINID
jgi:hypothetical protein